MEIYGWLCAFFLAGILMTAGRIFRPRTGMRKTTAVISAFIFLLVTPAALAEDAVKVSETVVTTDRYGTSHYGAREMYGPVTLVNLHGTWQEMGEQYGRLLKDRLIYVNQFIEKKMETADKDLAAAIVATQSENALSHINDFYRGAAKGSGLSVPEIQKINCLERLPGMLQCSAAIAWDEYTNGDLIIGRNYDYGSSFHDIADDIAVTIYHPADGSLPVATIGYVGEIYAVNAMNPTGLFLEYNNGTPTTGSIKAPPSFTGTSSLFDIMFRARAIGDLDRFFNTVRASSGCIINAADATDARSYEWTYAETKRGDVGNTESLIVSSNYFLNPDWSYPVPEDEKSWMGKTRRDGLLALCRAQKGNIDVEAMKRIITTEMKDGGAANTFTVYQIVTVPRTQEMWIRVVDRGDFVKIDLTKYWENAEGESVQKKAA